MTAIQRKEIVAKLVKSKKKEVNPFDLLDVPDEKMPGYYEARPATIKQMEYLQKHGYETKGRMTFWHAKRLCEHLSQRKKLGLCTWKQARLLASFGYSTDMKFEEASKTIDRLFKKGADGKSSRPFNNMTKADWAKYHREKKRKKAEAQKAAEAEADKLAELEASRNKKYEF